MTSKELIKLLKKNGFEEIRQNGSHKFFKNKKTSKQTTVPYHNEDLGKGIVQAILRQTGLKK